MGDEALHANTTSSRNTAIGSGALKSNTTAEQNTALGRRAGAGITIGSNNVMIGFEAGNIGTITTQGQRHILIGPYTRSFSATGNDSIVLGYDVAASGGATITFGSGGTDTTCSYGSTSWSTPSDERLKKDVATSTAGLSFINDLRPVTFKWKNAGDIPDTFNGYKEGSSTPVVNANTNHGFIAQEVKTALDAHSEIKDGFDMWAEGADGRQRVGEAALIPILVKAIQELSAKNEALLTRIEALEG